MFGHCIPYTVYMYVGDKAEMDKKVALSEPATSQKSRKRKKKNAPKTHQPDQKSQNIRFPNPVRQFTPSTKSGTKEHMLRDNSEGTFTEEHTLRNNSEGTVTAEHTLRDSSEGTDTGEHTLTDNPEGPVTAGEHTLKDISERTDAGEHTLRDNSERTNTLGGTRGEFL